MASETTTVTQRERKARVALGVALASYGGAIGAAEFVDGMRSVEDTEERYKRSRQCWSDVDRCGENVMKAVQRYARAVRMKARAQG